MPRITESVGDIFAAPPNSVLLHACNCKGSWGSGVALEFKSRYPAAYDRYHEECTTPNSPFHQKSLLGSTLLIPPQEEDLPSPSSQGHWIACLFTSIDYGKKRASADVILESTRKAMGDLAKKLKFQQGRDVEIGNLWAVRINSGKFGVPWERSKMVLGQCGLDIHVVRPPGEDEAPPLNPKGSRAAVVTPTPQTPSVASTKAPKEKQVPSRTLQAEAPTTSAIGSAEDGVAVPDVETKASKLAKKSKKDKKRKLGSREDDEPTSKSKKRKEKRRKVSLARDIAKA